MWLSGSLDNNSSTRKDHTLHGSHCQDNPKTHLTTLRTQHINAYIHTYMHAYHACYTQCVEYTFTNHETSLAWARESKRCKTIKSTTHRMNAGCIYVCVYMYVVSCKHTWYMRRCRPSRFRSTLQIMRFSLNIGAVHRTYYIYIHILYIYTCVCVCKYIISSICAGRDWRPPCVWFTCACTIENEVDNVIT